MQRPQKAEHHLVIGQNLRQLTQDLEMEVKNMRAKHPSVRLGLAGNTERLSLHSTTRLACYM